MLEDTSIKSDVGVRILSFNVAKNFSYMDTILQTCKNRFDIIFFQEPSWRLIRKAPSTHNREGEDVVGAPSHPDWLTIVRTAGPDDEVRQYRAHEYAKSLRVRLGVNPTRSLDFVRQRVTKTALDRWGAIFTVSSTYRGKNFLPLKSLKDEPLTPSYANGGTWLPVAGKKTALTARMTRCILAHAPIGEYYH